MTQEEKAKRYDEVLAMAKECLKDGTITSTATGYIETIFPELKKSEDESIIRDICVVLESSATRIFKEKGQMPVWYDRAIAWLEKQGEQKPQGKSALEALNEEKVDNANKGRVIDNFTQISKKNSKNKELKAEYNEIKSKMNAIIARFN